MNKGMRVTKYILIGSLLVCGAAVTVAHAQNNPTPILRVKFDQGGSVIVGQRIKMTVSILVPTWLSGAPVFPQIDIPGTVTVLSEEWPVNLTEDIRGSTWSGLSVNYYIYPVETGEHRLPAAEVAVVYALADGKESPEFKVKLPRKSFKAVIPIEAASLDHFIATTRLELTEKFDRRLTGLKVGDSIQRTVTISGEKTLAMLLPPISFTADSGLAVYQEQAEVQDYVTNRGDYERRLRIESVTYIIQQEGDHELPALSVLWWDLSRNRVRESKLPAVKFHADLNPDLKTEVPFSAKIDSLQVSSPKTESIWQRIKPLIIPIFLAVPLLFYGFKFGRTGLRSIILRWQRAKQQKAGSEATLFKHFRAACKSNEPIKSYQSFMAWLDKAYAGAGPATVAQFVRDSGNLSLAQRTDQLHALVFSEKANENSWSGQDFYREVAHVRRNIGQKGGEAREDNGVLLPSLNPGNIRQNLRKQTSS